MSHQRVVVIILCGRLIILMGLTIYRCSAGGSFFNKKDGRDLAENAGGFFFNKKLTQGII